jgi:ATP-dependent Clp protease ATP-binding subunit ClpA
VQIDQVQGEIRRELERRFSPEFRNRIDEVVLFAPLARDEVRQIARCYLAQLEQTAAKAGKTIEIDEDALELIAIEGYSLAFGARFLKRVIDERVKLPITVSWKEGSHFHVGAAGQEIVVEAVSARPAARDQHVA